MADRKFLDKQVCVAGLCGTAIFLFEYHFCYIFGLYRIEKIYSETARKRNHDLNHTEYEVKKAYEDFYIQYLEEHNYVTDLDDVKKIKKLDCYDEFNSIIHTFLKRVQPEYKEMLKELHTKAIEIAEDMF